MHLGTGFGGKTAEMDIRDLRNRLERMKGQRNQIRRSLAELEKHIEAVKADLYDHEQAREVIKIVAQTTQNQLSFHISDIVSLALTTVFDDPYQLSVEFVQRREHTECDLTFSRDGMTGFDPMKDSGGGSIEVAALALRVASWSMYRPRSQNILILDEPFSRVKGEDANRRVLDLVQTVSKKLDLQILMIADERIPREDLLERADRAFEVIKKRGVAEVKQIGGES